MGKQFLQTLKGFRDFLPEKMAVRSEVIRRLKSVFEKYGFEELQTPSLEYQDVLLGKYGEEAEKLMYLFKDQGGREVGMKYDLTVPLARVAASNTNLPIPFKRYQIQPVWRADKPQKGRYREIYQCDIDTIGSISPLSDAEIIAVISEGLKALGFTNYKIKINSRKVLFSIMEKANLPKDSFFTVIQSIDKLDKKTEQQVKKELVEKGITNSRIKSVFNNLAKASPDKYLQEVVNIAKQLGVENELTFSPTLARGLDYYTGAIFETVVEKPKIGSITGGGRYDELLKFIGGPDLPAVGTTIGLDRICDVIEELNLWENFSKASTKVLVSIFSEKTLEASLRTAEVLRRAGINTEVYPDTGTKLDRQLKYADKKGVPWVVIIGPEEIVKNTIVLKNMRDKKQEEIPLSALTTRIR